MITKRYTAVAIFILFLAFACRQPVSILPEGNVDKLNTEKDQTAPSQRPVGAAKNTGPCYNEFHSGAAGENDGVTPSADFLVELLGEKGAANAGAISFLSDSSGFFSVAHPPDERGAALLGLPYGGIVGGTDLFMFDFVDGEYTFKNLGEPINSRTWDSHPFAAQDGDGTILLLWASDRMDYIAGYGSPFYEQIRLTVFGDSVSGNTDLFFAFYKDGAWGKVRNFGDVGGEISSEENEITPFIYCLCHNPVLLYASDRDSSITGDFDLYSAKIVVDYEEQMIYQAELSKKIFDFPDSAASYAMDCFPFVPRPYPGADARPNLYFSSDRYNSAFVINEDTLKECAGGFDIYRFPVDMECREPKVELKLTILDTEDPGRIVKTPVAALLDENGVEIEKAFSNPAVFKLKAGKKYKAAGGSLFDKIECEGSDSVLSHYAFRRISRKPPIIFERKLTEEYDTTINGSAVLEYDSTFIVKAYHTSELSEVKSDSSRPIYALEFSDDSILVTFREIARNVIITGGKKITKKQRITVYDTIPAADTVYLKVKDTLKRSERSLAGCFPDFTPKNDTTISDIVTILPRYYHFPPCRWEYITHSGKYRRNAPYFQTGFWEVNTSSNLDKRLELLNSKENADASFIELHPKNQYFGYKRSSLNEEEKQKRKEKRNRRIREYLAFAKIIDNNLDVIADEIALEILPAFNELLSKTDGTQNKLLIQVHSYSDLRPVKRGAYFGKETVEYISGRLEEDDMRIICKHVKAPPGASLIGEDNETLSILRAYFGYKEVFKKLSEDGVFMDMFDKGEVLTPEMTSSEEAFQRQMQNVKIIFLIEGRRVDPEGTFEIPGYVGKKGDYSSLDPVRRINVIVNRIEYFDGMIKDSPCCSKAAEPEENHKRE